MTFLVLIALLVLGGALKDTTLGTVLIGLAMAALFIGGCLVLLAAMLKVQGQPHLDFSAVATVSEPLTIDRVRAALERHGWTVTEELEARGEFEIQTHTDWAGILSVGVETRVDAPSLDVGGESALFSWRQTATMAPCLLRVALRRAVPRGTEVTLSMRGWGDGFINAWALRRRLRAAVAHIRKLDAASATQAS